MPHENGVGVVEAVIVSTVVAEDDVVEVNACGDVVVGCNVVAPAGAKRNFFNNFIKNYFIYFLVFHKQTIVH